MVRKERAPPNNGGFEPFTLEQKQPINLDEWDAAAAWAQGRPDSEARGGDHGQSEVGPDRSVPRGALGPQGERPPPDRRRTPAAADRRHAATDAGPAPAPPQEGRAHPAGHPLRV